jgi:hypothetical protein
MPDDTSAAPESVPRGDAVNWRTAVFGAAVLGGFVYGVLARGFQLGEPVQDGVAGWLPVGIVTIGMLVLGLAALHLAHTSRFRTVAAAIAAAPATGGIVALEIFIVWAVNQIV